MHAYFVTVILPFFFSNMRAHCRITRVMFALIHFGRLSPNPLKQGMHDSIVCLIAHGIDNLNSLSLMQWKSLSESLLVSFAHKYHVSARVLGGSGKVEESFFCFAPFAFVAVFSIFEHCRAHSGFF